MDLIKAPKTLSLKDILCACKKKKCIYTENISIIREQFAQSTAKVFCLKEVDFK